MTRTSDTVIEPDLFQRDQPRTKGTAAVQAKPHTQPNLSDKQTSSTEQHKEKKTSCRFKITVQQVQDFGLKAPMSGKKGSILCGPLKAEFGGTHVPSDFI